MAKITVDSNRKTYTSDYTPADQDRAVFFGNPFVDHLFVAVSTLGAEVWALRRRMKIMEKLMETHQGTVTTEMIEKYVPTPEEENRWAAERNELVSAIFQDFSKVADIPYASTVHSPRGRT